MALWGFHACHQKILCLAVACFPADWWAFGEIDGRICKILVTESWSLKSAHLTLRLRSPCENPGSAAARSCKSFLVFQTQGNFSLRFRLWIISSLVPCNKDVIWTKHFIQETSTLFARKIFYYAYAFLIE